MVNLFLRLAIHHWVHKYAKLVKDYVSSLEPKLSGKYHHDETEIKVERGRQVFLGNY